MRVLEWGPADAAARAFQRPDGQWQLRLPEEVAGWAALLATRPPELVHVVLTNGEGDRGTELGRLGFVATRTEQLWRVPVRGLARGFSTGRHDLREVTDCDLDQVTALDNAVRAQIPGSEGWEGTVSDLRESLVDDEFDPRLYLVAVHHDTGDYDGLVRVWDRRPDPRLGCVGVRASWRRTRLGPALLTAVASTLQQRGVTHVVTETDVHNRDSHALAARHGGVPVGRTVEWVLRPAR